MSQNARIINSKKKRKKVCRKRKPKANSGLVNDSSEDSQGASSYVTTEDDYSDDEHVFLVSSVANLRRRELMNLGPMKNKIMHKPRKAPSKDKDKGPLLSLSATKEVIEQILRMDERNVKLRSPKRHPLSEESWGEWTTWEEILKEGKDREYELTLQRPEPEKAMILQVPGSKPSKPIVKTKPPPVG